MSRSHLSASCRRLLVVVVLLFAGAAGAQPFVESLVLAGAVRSGRTTWDYTYRVVLSNPDMPRTGVTATVTSISPATQVIQGTIAAGDMAAATRKTPAATITLRHDRRYPFSRAALRWQVRGELASGLAHVTSGGIDRTFYLQLPDDYASNPAARPLIIAYHGTGLSHAAWLNGFYQLKQSVGNGAILIYPDALYNAAAGYTQWDEAADTAMFEDLLASLPLSLRFDSDRLFITGHSSGAGFADVIGCRYGDRIRGIAPVVGTLTSFSCTGAFAVMDIVGRKDPLAGVSQVANNFWALYNGYDSRVSTPWTVPPCVDYSAGSRDYPVVFCLHDEGDGPTADNPVSTAHNWPSFAGQAIWTFFSGLNHAAPRTAPPPGGGNDRALGANDTTMSFTLRYPLTIPRPVQGAIVLFPAGTVLPAVGEQPTAFMSLGFPLGDVVPGGQQSYQARIKYTPFGGDIVFPGTYTVGIFVYVDGGSFPQPAVGVDHAALVSVDLVDKKTPIVIPGVLDLVPFQTAP